MKSKKPITGPMLTCPCGASAPDTTKERKRFQRRHPALCSERKAFNKQLAQGVRSVEDNKVADE